MAALVCRLRNMGDVRVSRIMGATKMITEQGTYHWQLALGAVKPRTLRLTANKVKMAPESMPEPVQEKPEPPAIVDGFPEAAAAKLRVHVRRVCKKGLRSPEDICDELKDMKVYPVDEDGGYLPRALIASSCVLPVLELLDNPFKTNTIKIMDMLDEGKTRAEISEILGLSTRYIAGCIWQVSKRNKCSFDYTEMGLRPARRKKKNG